MFPVIKETLRPTEPASYDDDGQREGDNDDNHYDDDKFPRAPGQSDITDASVVCVQPN